MRLDMAIWSQFANGTFHTAWKVFKHGDFSGPYFPAFGLNTERYGPEKNPYLDTFQAVWDFHIL